MLEITIVDKSGRLFRYQDNSCGSDSGKASLEKSSQNLVSQYISEKNLDWDKLANVSSVSVQFTDGIYACSNTIYNRDGGFEHTNVRSWSDVATWTAKAAPKLRGAIVSHRSGLGWGTL
jgi:hypothetical protein